MLGRCHGAILYRLRNRWPSPRNGNLLIIASVIGAPASLAAPPRAAAPLSPLMPLGPYPVMMLPWAANRDIELVYDKRKDPRLLTIVFSRDNLSFASGACEVDPATREAMRGTLKRIFPEICRAVGSVGTGLQKSIALEGHTDNAPPLGVSCAGVPSASACYGHKHDDCKKQGFESNVQLSAARAQYVFFQARDVLRDDPAIASCLDRNFMVAGRGPMEPLDGGAWDAVRSAGDNEKNRRVVIKVRVMAASVDRSSP